MGKNQQNNNQSSKKNTVRLQQSDWEAIMPEVYFPLGSTQVEIVPLGLKTLTDIMKKLSSVAGQLSKIGITKDNWNKFGNFIKITQIVLDNVPEIFSESINLHPDDLGRLSVSITCKILDKILDVNIESHADLEITLKNLWEKVDLLKSKITKETKEESKSEIKGATILQM